MTARVCAVRIPRRDSRLRSPRGHEEATPAGTAVAEPDTAVSDPSLDRPWVTIVWDDPVNLMRYVTYVFQKVFGYSESRASQLMMQVHTEGKAVVSTGDRDKVEADVRKLHAAGLWATMQRDS
ncbi:ATP-dependent Clp protease adapter ClpS [Williamsia sp. CHRR-6]|uniref:ATP-dependent Clp protease adapter ClpS n=1 Tax=Williamsia sp. CHRR-6 TaxID=2835871 RepID=UPI001BD98DC6|nr:ATP-dependent Clp protease adapter ClpS [Williamsia sp. CHRR-6]MBT0568244.1 ATP-dependent Clp protease adapter ClpS [Williamsia sp. CHRR-6]